LKILAGDEELAETMFEELDWQHPESLLEDWKANGEIAWCPHCAVYVQTYDEEIWRIEMDDFILKITAEIVITQEDVDDIMSTALDSSMLQCWCSEVNVVGRYLGEYASDQISRGGELELYEIEEETYRSLTLENFKTGLLKYLSEDCMPVARRYDGTWGVDPGMIDEIAADEIIQYALFEEIVYS